MAFNAGEVVAKIKADVSEFEKGVDKVKTGSKDMGDKVEGVTGKISGLVKGMIAFGAVVGAGAFFKDIIDSAKTAEAEMVKFNSLINKTFGKTPAIMEEMKKGALETADAMVKLGFDDEDTAVAMAKSLAVTKDLTQSQKEMALAGDFARLQSIGIGEAQKLLQMAYMGNARVLKQYGIELEDGATKADIFAKIEAVAGGQAEAFAQSYAGKLETFNVQWTNLKETLGGIFLPMLVTVMTAVSDFITFLTQKAQGLGVDWNAVFSNMLLVWQTLSTEFNNIWVNVLQPLIVAISSFITENWGIISLVTSTVWNTIMGIIKIAWATIYAILSVGLALLTGDWAKAWENIKHAGSIALDGIKQIFESMLVYLTSWGKLVFDKITRPFEDAWNKAQEMARKIREAISGAFDTEKRNSPSISDRLSMLKGKVTETLESINVPVYSHGIASQMAGVGSSSFGNIVINMNGSIGSQSDATRYGIQMGDAIIKQLQNNIRF